MSGQWISEARLRPQARLDGKWLKTNIQLALTREGGSELWNELVKDGEVATNTNDGIYNSAGALAKKGKHQLAIDVYDPGWPVSTTQQVGAALQNTTVFISGVVGIGFPLFVCDGQIIGETGRYYCGMKVLSCSCCDGHCGPNNGCNCPPCQQLDREEEAHQVVEDARPKPSQPIIDGWTWGQQPDVGELRECLQSVLLEHQNLCLQASGTTLSATRLQQRLAVLERYFTALCRQTQADRKPPSKKRQANQSNLNKQKSSSVKPAEKATMGLARVGSRAALSFAFAFLRRAWRSGEDADLCSELLQESLDALRSLPEATLFEDGSVSSVWLEVVERATKFLHSVVAG
ncbi:hypothetical protein BaRGS_00039741, partial [Batillaria attramentaria]